MAQADCYLADWPGPLALWQGEIDAYVFRALEPGMQAGCWDAPDAADSQYQRLPAELRWLGALVTLDAQVCNGGFDQFFENSYGALAEEALVGFRAFGLHEFAELCEAVCACLPRPVPRNQDERLALLEALWERREQHPAYADAAALAQARRQFEHWDAYTDDYFALMRRPFASLPAGYRAGLWGPLSHYIDQHPERFFRMPEAN
ncbi:DMP19 family protein [Chitinilyticum aquatile]|uniref:DMP19 family protein n=1 Tax=Chitinilyticum aquatile TaxID=362520 RepID=UPI0003F8EB33|nr:DUF4375 domain-containing protein [Chitinilyticum aquatile]